MTAKTLLLTCSILLAWTLSGLAHESVVPRDLKTERELPSRYPYVVEDLLRHCAPETGFWVDLGAGKGQLTIPLIKETGSPVVMLDPDVEAMADGLRLAREKGLQDRLFAVVGVAEDMPFPDDSVDLVASRGSIFFWDDPARGLREVYRVLRPGGKAYIGGGAGSGYPDWATKTLIQQRKQKMEGEQAERWQRFDELRRPQQMREWAEQAGLPEFQVMGRGAISAQDPRVGQGVWLLFEKRPEVVAHKDTDTITVTREGDTRAYTITSPSGIAGATISRGTRWPKQVIFRLWLHGLESCRVTWGDKTLAASVLSHGDHAISQGVTVDGQERKLEADETYWMTIERLNAKGEPIQHLPQKDGYFQLTIPTALLAENPASLVMEWIDFYR